MSNIRVECAGCEGRGRVMTTPCDRCGGAGFITMPDPQPELTRLREREKVFVGLLSETLECMAQSDLSDRIEKALATISDDRE